MQCKVCGFDNARGVKFCGECGAALKLKCPSCGSENAPGIKFCGECGKPLAEAAKPAPPREPRAYTPKHLAEKILTSRGALEGERKQVTVLFADVKGSMDLAEQLDPEEWHGILDRFFQVLTDGVHRFEGTVNQYTGDGIMALFGAPIAHEDHAQRACYAALHLRDELHRYADALRIGRGLGFTTRIGINSGEVVVGKIGDDLRMDYTAQGHTVGLAQRMEQIAEPGRIYVAEATAHFVDGFFQLRSLGRHEVKGVSLPVEVFELESAVGVLTRLQASERRGFSRFVGRQGEMHALDSALDAALEAQGRIVGVVGQAGVGKSRLCFEFVVRTRGRGISVYECHCPAHGKTIPYIPVLELFRAYFGIFERDTAVEARRKIAGGLLLLDEGFREFLPLVFEFLAVPDPKNPAPEMDAQVKQRQIYGFLRTLVRARSAAEPAVILVDDLHWVDDASDAFLAELFEAIEGTRTLCLVNFRPEYSAAWMHKASYQQIALKPLGPREIDELVSHLIGADPSVSVLAKRIRERTQGNPFFIEETIQELVETGKLDGRRGAYRVIEMVDTPDLPPTVQSVLAARIDRLAEKEKSLLQAAAVIGKNFPASVLREVVETAEEGLARSLSVLRDREFFYQESFFPEVEYAFKHPLTQEVAYHSQLSSRRRAVHASVARVIEKLYAAKLDERAALLAHHWEAAGEAFEAARWHRRAAEWVGLSNPLMALRHWRAACALLSQVEESQETLALGLTARARILLFGWRTSMSEEEVTALVNEGKALAARCEDRGEWALLLVASALVRAMAGSLQDYPQVAREALQLVEGRTDVAPRLICLLHCVYSHLVTGRLPEASDYVDEALAVRLEDPTQGAVLMGTVPSIFFVLFRGVLSTHMGRLAEASTAVSRGIEQARKHHDQTMLCRGHITACDLAWFLGDAHGALDHGRKGIEIAETIGEYWRVEAYARVGRALALQAEWAPAVEHLERGLGIAREARTALEWEPLYLGFLAEALLGLGEVERARQTAQEAVEIAERRSNPFLAALGRLALARALMRAGRDSLSVVETSLANARSVLADLSARAYAPFLHVELARLGGLKGDEGTRQRELREAHRLFLEIGAPIRAAEVAKDLDR
jgi:class 3 adenylate cyclase/tetratricopeptide (TPR) repeat protein